MSRPTHSPRPCLGGAGLFAQTAAVLDPLATAHGGHPIAVVTPILARTWLAAFDHPLLEPTLTQCARAIAERAPWAEALWPDGWQRPPHRLASPQAARRWYRGREDE